MTPPGALAARCSPRLPVLAARCSRRLPVTADAAAARDFVRFGGWSHYPATVDDIDRQILAVLAGDGRISNADLAARVGLSPSPCLRRVRRLEESGAIRGYRAVVDPDAIGRGLRVFVGVRLGRHSRAEVAAFEQAVTRLAEVVHVHHVTGNVDYLLHVEVADLEAYERFHSARLAELPGVAAVNSYVTMKTLEPVRD